VAARAPAGRTGRAVAYQPIAREVLLVNSGALTNPDYRLFTYTKLRRPMFPLDNLE